MNPTPGLVIADRFRLVRPLRQGGMGAVWVAQHTQLDVPCAVKFIHAEAATSAELRARFEREAKAAAQLRTPHVVQIHDHGVWDGTPYIAMELLEGEDLGRRLAQVGTLDARTTVAIFSQVARALGKAHSMGLVHRDLKPDNIFLARDDDREIAKILDFGIAKSNVGGVNTSTLAGSLLGTPYYMSPEQAQGKPVDHRSDLWALGVVAYQCLTGRLPFDGEAFGDLLMKIMVHPIPMPSHVAHVPPGFDAWWMRAAARNPDERFQSAKELVDALSLATGVSMVALDRSSSGVSTSLGVRVSAPSYPPIGTPPVAVLGAAPMMTPAPMHTPAPYGGMPPGATPIPVGGQPQVPIGAAPVHVLGAAPGMTAAPMAADPRPRGTSRGSVIGVIAVAVVLGIVATVFVVRGSSSKTNAATTATATAEQAATAAPTHSAPVVVAPAASASATASASAEVAAPTPSTSASDVPAEAPPAATVAAGPVPTVPRPFATSRPMSTGTTTTKKKKDVFSSY